MQMMIEGKKCFNNESPVDPGLIILASKVLKFVDTFTYQWMIGFNNLMLHMVSIF